MKLITALLAVLLLVAMGDSASDAAPAGTEVQPRWASPGSPEVSPALSFMRTPLLLVDAYGVTLIEQPGYRGCWLPASEIDSLESVLRILPPESWPEGNAAVLAANRDVPSSDHDRIRDNMNRVTAVLDRLCRRAAILINNC
jgi:hypothetical protein